MEARAALRGARAELEATARRARSLEGELGAAGLADKVLQHELRHSENKGASAAADAAAARNRLRAAEEEKEVAMMRLHAKQEYMRSEAHRRDKEALHAALRESEAWSIHLIGFHSSTRRCARARRAG